MGAVLLAILRDHCRKYTDRKLKLPLRSGTVQARPFLLIPWFQDRADLFEQSFVAGWLILKAYSSQLKGQCPGSLIRGARDEDDRNVPARGCQMTLKLKSTHTRQLHIENEARGAGHLIGENKLLCRCENFHPKARRPDGSRYRPTHRFTVFDDRDESNLQQATSTPESKVHGGSGQIHCAFV